VTAAPARIIVVGGGIVAASAALALARALPLATIRLLRPPLDPAALADRLPATQPIVHRFHAAVGIDGAALVRRAGTSHLLATHYRDWGRGGRSCWIAHGAHGDGPDFARIWHRSGAAAFADASAAARMAAANRLAAEHPDIDPALRLEVEPYLAVLLALAQQAGVEVHACGQVTAERGPEGLAALIYDGERMAADLFIDASGPAALLLATLDPAFEDWSARLPGSHLLFGEAAPAVPNVADAAIACPLGWRFRSNGRGATRYLLAHNGDEAAAAAALLGVEPAEAVAIRPGRRPAPWIGNTIAIGDAAAALGPLGGVNLALAQSAILRLVELLPGRVPEPLLAREYNRRRRDETDAAADFQALFLIQAGASGPFWARASEAERSPSLAHLLDHFAARGRIPYREENPLAPELWRAALHGLGVIQRGTDARALALDPALAAERVRQAGAHATAAAAAAPPYPEALARAARGR
jgi:tryptophan 7-halogenase